MCCLGSLMLNMPSWLVREKKRMSRIGSSDIASLLGIPNERSSLSLYQNKKGLGSRSGGLHKYARRGIELEPVALKMYADIIEKPLTQDFSDLDVIHAHYDYMGCFLDGLSCCGQFCVEVKCLAEHGNHKRSVQTRSIQDRYYAQIQFQMFCTGRDYIHYFGFCEGKTPSILCTVYRDKEFLNVVEERCHIFWTQCIELQIPPRTSDPRFQFLPELFSNKRLAHICIGNCAQDFVDQSFS